MIALGAKFPDGFNLAGGFDFRLHHIDAKLSGHCGGGAAVVAGDHDKFDTERVQLPDGLGGGGFYRIGHGEDAGRFAIEGDKHGGLSLFLKLHGGGFKRIKSGDGLVFEEIRFTDHHGAVRRCRRPPRRR